MTPRSDIAKCDGGGMPCCEKCVRKLAPAGIDKNWTVPIEDKKGGCQLFADVRMYGHLYGLKVAA